MSTAINAPTAALSDRGAFAMKANRHHRSLEYSSCWYEK
jgi:hypothetical protein